jgi:hypothetical protein
MTHRRHLVLDAGPADHLVDIVEANLADPENTGLQFFLDEVDQPARDLTHYVFLEEHGRARVVLVVDTTTPVQYLIVEAHDPVDTGRLTDALTRDFQVVSQAQLREEAEQNLDEQPGHLVRMALGAPPEADPEVIDILCCGLRSSERDTRLAAVEAAGLTLWPDMLAPLRETASAEQDAELKRFAETTADMLQQR